MKRITALFSITVLGLGLAGCQPINAPYNPYPQQHNSVEGQWADPRGVISSFYNGVFETRTSDTQEKLAEGNYVMRAPQMIEIEMRSLVRGTVSRVNCSLGNNSAQLFCTSQDGNHFVLNRKNSNVMPVTYVNPAR